MSDYGLQLINSGGEIQIDGLYKNFAFNQSGSGSITSGGTPWNINITDVSSAPIFVTKADASIYHSVVTAIKSGSNYASIEGRASGSMTCYWKVYIPGPISSTPDYGLVVKNSSNEVVFNSDDEWMKIVSVAADSLADGSSTNDHTVDDATNNYFYLTDPSFSAESTYIGGVLYQNIFYSRGILKINSTTVRVARFIYHSTVTPADVNYSVWTDNYTLIEIEA